MHDGCEKVNMQRTLSCPHTFSASRHPWQFHSNGLHDIEVTILSLIKLKEVYWQKCEASINNGFWNERVLLNAAAFEGQKTALLTAAFSTFAGSNLCSLSLAFFFFLCSQGCHGLALCTLKMYICNEILLAAPATCYCLWVFLSSFLTPHTHCGTAESLLQEQD